MKKRTIICVLLALVVVFSSAVSCFAKVSAMSVNGKRNSNTSATGKTTASLTGVASTCTAKMVLQEKYNGKWRTATGVAVKSVSLTKKKVSCIGFSYDFKLKKGTTYRINSIIVDVQQGKKSSYSHSSNSF